MGSSLIFKRLRGKAHSMNEISKEDIELSARQLHNQLDEVSVTKEQLEYDISHAIESYEIPLQDAVTHVAEQRTAGKVIIKRNINSDDFDIKVIT